MVKFFSFLMVPLSVLAGAAVAKLPEYLWPVILFFCCIPALTGAIFYVSCGWIGLNDAELAAGEWIMENTPQRSVFASSSSHNSPIDSVAGRLKVIGFEGWVVNYGMDYESRRRDMAALFCGPRDEAGRIMEKYNASYVYISRKEKEEYGCDPFFRGLSGFSEEYSDRGITIYRYSTPSLR